MDPAREVIRRAMRARVFSVAAVDVGSSRGTMWREAFEGGIDAPFDLASLTKVIATTSTSMQLAGEGRLRLDETLTAIFPEWRGRDREGATVRDLLEHASGLPARLIDPPPESRREFEHDICSIRLEYEPRRSTVYSDLGFILLGFLVADRGGARLDRQFDAIGGRLAGVEPDLAREPLTFTLEGERRRRAIPTRPVDDDARRGRTLVGEVHDNYAAALGGVAGHAGLFGTAAAVGAFARAVLRGARGDQTVPPPLSPALVAQATTRSAVAGSSRALGWDTMLPNSSCGTRMSATAFGHVGFTGTSMWIDPERDRYFVLLTNRAFGGGTLEEMRDARRAFHDALGDL